MTVLLSGSGFFFRAVLFLVEEMRVCPYCREEKELVGEMQQALLSTTCDDVWNEVPTKK